MMCTTVLHGGVCHCTSTLHKSGNKMKETSTLHKSGNKMKEKKKLISSTCYHMDIIMMDVSLDL